jgi:PAS domain S-box-containing protein
MPEDDVSCGPDQNGELLSVLVVEDDIGLNRLIQKTLQRAGFPTDGALNGTDAVAKMAINGDMLLLLDYSLPDMTARELVETLCAKGCRPPFVVMTGYGDERIAVEMMKLNASDYLVKDACLIQRLPSVIGEICRKLLVERRLEETRTALQKSEERYRRFVEMSTEGVWRCDIEPPVSRALGEFEQAEAILRRGRLAECNNAYLHQFGHERANLALGTPLYDLLTGTHEDKIELALRTIRSGYRSSNLETMDRLKDGRTVWTLSNVVAIEEDGRFVCVWGTTRDITSRKRAEETLRQSEAQKNAILNGITSNIALLDSELRILWTNKAAADSVNRSQDELAGQPCYSFWGNPARPCESCPGVKAFQTGKPEHAIVRTPDGRIWDERGEPVFDTEGNVTAVVEIAENVTERKRGDEERLRLATAVEHAAETVIITNAQGIVNYVNPAFEQMFGLARGAAPGEHAAWIINGGGEQFAELLREVAQGGRAWNGRINGTDVKGRNLVIEATVSPIRDDLGRTSELVLLLRDITKESALEAQLRQTQKMEAIGTLAGGIAHDFNNILSAIIGYTQMAMTGIEPDSQPAQDLAQVVTAGRRAADLVRQIMTFGRKQDQAQLPLRLDLLAREALSLLRASIPTTVEMQSRIEENCDCVMGDPTQLHQVIMNLCMNACHAMEKDGGLFGFSIEPVTVDEQRAALVHNLHPGEHLRMTVTDTGCGMDQTTLERAFDPFFTTKPQGKGTGLGLSIAHGIIRSHNGAIDIQSEPGKGTTVRVYLPAVRTPAHEGQSPHDAPLSGCGERILFVDDEEMLVKLGKRTLLELGYAPTVLCDADEAFELFRSNPDAFDLLITDQTMPRCTGLELATKVHAIRPDLPVILASGLDLAIDEEDAAAAGLTELLGKPVSSYKLAKSVSRALATGHRTGLDTGGCVQNS